MLNTLSWATNIRCKCCLCWELETICRMNNGWNWNIIYNHISFMNICCRCLHCLYRRKVRIIDIWVYWNSGYTRLCRMSTSNNCYLPESTLQCRSSKQLHFCMWNSDLLLLSKTCNYEFSIRGSSCGWGRKCRRWTGRDSRGKEVRIVSMCGFVGSKTSLQHCIFCICPKIFYLLRSTYTERCYRRWLGRSWSDRAF